MGLTAADLDEILELVAWGHKASLEVQDALERLYRTPWTKSPHADGALGDAHGPDIRAALAAGQDPLRPQRLRDSGFRRGRGSRLSPRPASTLKAGGEGRAAGGSM